MAVHTTVGTTLYINEAVPMDVNDIDEFEGLSDTWVTIGQVTDMGNWGTTGSTASHQPLATGETENVKAFLDHGSRDIALGRDLTDEGQDLLKRLADSEGDRYNIVSVRIIHQSGLIQYATVQVTGFLGSISGGDSIHTATAGMTSRSRVLDRKPI